VNVDRVRVRTPDDAEKLSGEKVPALSEKVKSSRRREDAEKLSGEKVPALRGIFRKFRKNPMRRSFRVRRCQHQNCAPEHNFRLLMRRGFRVRRCQHPVGRERVLLLLTCGEAFG